MALPTFLHHALNQDCLENFLSRVRSIGIHHNNPSALEVMRRIRLLLIGCDSGQILTGNTIDEGSSSDENLVSADVLSAVPATLRSSEVTVGDMPHPTSWPCSEPGKFLQIFQNYQRQTNIMSGLTKFRLDT